MDDDEMDRVGESDDQEMGQGGELGDGELDKELFGYSDNNEAN